MTKQNYIPDNANLLAAIGPEAIFQTVLNHVKPTVSRPVISLAERLWVEYQSALAAVSRISSRGMWSRLKNWRKISELKAAAEKAIGSLMMWIKTSIKRYGSHE